MNREQKGGLVSGIIVLIVVLVGGWFLTAREREGTMAADHSARAASTTPISMVKGTSTMSASSMGGMNPTVLSNTDAVVIANQPAGMAVTVESVTLSKSGWVAIRDNTGRTLGAALFPAGVQSNVSVPLLRATSAGSRYQALLYYDDGNKNFNLHTETLVENADGSVAGVMFITQ